MQALRVLGLATIILAVSSGQSPVVRPDGEASGSAARESEASAAVASAVPAAPDEPAYGDVVFSLEEQQVREVERLRKFRPTPAQLAILRAARPGCPNVLDVVTARFQGCCCEGRNKARWNAPRTVTIPIGYLSPWDREEETELKMLAADGDTAARRELASPPAEPALADSTTLYRHRDDLLADLVMDRAGHVYYEGRRVADAELTGILAEARRRLPAGFARDFDLRLPPAFEEFDDLTCINRAIEVAVLASRLGYALRCGG